MAITVPERYREALQDLARLDRASKQKLLKGVAALEPFPPPREIERKVRAAWRGLDRRHATSVTEALLSVAAQRRRWDAAELAESVSASSSLELSARDRRALRELLERLVELEALTSMSRGLDVAMDYERVLEGSRIVTDVRPIFGNDVTQPPIGAAVVSILSLDYFRDDESRKFQVAMDESDLRSLREVIDRALTKTVTLKKSLSSINIAYFDIEDASE